MDYNFHRRVRGAHRENQSKIENWWGKPHHTESRLITKASIYFPPFLTIKFFHHEGHEGSRRFYIFFLRGLKNPWESALIRGFISFIFLCDLCG
jgi:hypothetical protein